MKGLRMTVGVVVAVFIAVGWSLVPTGAHDEKKPPAKATHSPRHSPNRGGDHDNNHELGKLNTIIANQRRLLERLDRLDDALGDSSIPSQLTSLRSGILDSVNGEFAVLKDLFGGLAAQCSTPDLLPLPIPGAFAPYDYCRIVGNGPWQLQVRVHNQGGIDAPPSMTRVAFAGATPQTLPTGVLGAFNGSTDLLFDVPSTCLPATSGSDCRFTISVDVDNAAAESDEGNNTVQSNCLIVL